MICPTCGNSKRVEIDTHSDGYVQNLQECGACGTLWTRKNNKDIIIHAMSQKAAVGA